MTKFFKGLATSGAWSCFDEFNRISLTVLSVISQIIIVIQGAIRENLNEFMIEETTIHFNNECAIFITMNPMYSGRTELPDNLKSLFRPVSMIIPDSMLISEILLYSYGFFEAKSLAQKIVYTFYLAKQQLSQQVHYDFGLRAIKIILSSAGVLKLKASGIVDLGAKFTDDLKTREEFAEKERRLDPSRIEEEDEEDLSPSAVRSRKRSRQYKIKSKPSTSNFKEFKKMKKSLKRKETKRMQKEAKEAADAATKAKEAEQKGIHYSESSLSSKDALNKDDLSVSSLDSEDIIYTDVEINKNTMKVKEMVTQVYKAESKVVPVKEAEVLLATKLDFISDKKKGKTMASEQLIDELGIESADMLTDDKKIEEFIVLRAIKDSNLPKFNDTDTIIFESITEDIFQTSMKAQNKHNTLKNLIEGVLTDKGCQVSEEIVSRVMHLYQTITMRHGVMIVGSTLSGKTTAISTLEETLKRSRENEIQEKTVMYKHQKAKLMGKKYGKKLKNMKPGDESALDEIKLTPDDLKIIKAKCKNEGVETFYINPKSITIDQLMGNFDETSHDWVDGILAYLMRECSIDTSNKRKWIVFDGPIDPIWVENLNSVLDDNKKLTLNTGETIKLSPSMNILIEAENLSSCTPATISRWGMIYMQEEQISNKGLFNKWLKSLPDTIEENLFEIENMWHWFFPEILNLMKPNNMIYSCSQKWLILNFTRLFDSLIHDYYRDELYSNPNQDTYNLFGTQKDSGLKVNKFDKAKKVPMVSFADIESRFLNSINYKNLWIEAFFIFSMVWTFGCILKPHVMKEFNRIIKKKIQGNKDEIATVAQLRNKLRNEHNMKRYQEFEPSQDFKELPRPPYFLVPFPHEHSVFDIVFDLETNSWTTWESVKDEFPKPLDNELRKKSSYYNVFIQSEESIKYTYVISANILSNKSILLVGPTG